MKRMFAQNTLKDIVLLTLFTIGLTLLVWLPHLLAISNLYGLDFSQGFNTIYRNYDGMEYVVIAKSFYDPKIIASLPQSLSANYYAAHFPGYAMVILLFAPFVGFLKSMLLVSLGFTILSAIAFYFLVKHFALSRHPLFLSFVFFILPARWFIVHSVGSAEPMFIFFTIVCLYFFMKFEDSKNWTDLFFCGLAGAFAQFTRPPGILIFIALWLYLLYKKVFVGKKASEVLALIPRYFLLLLIPLTLLGMFYWYSQSYHDFFAYFHSGDNIHLQFPPYQVFNKHQFWVGDIWLEDIVYIFILGFLGGIMLLKDKVRPLGFFVLTYLTASIFVAHRDVSRYVLPIFPFVLIAFEKALVSKEFKIVLIIISLAIYLYAQNFIIANTAPFPNPGLFN